MFKSSTQNPRSNYGTFPQTSKEDEVTEKNSGPNVAQRAGNALLNAFKSPFQKTEQPAEEPRKKMDAIEGPTLIETPNPTLQKPA